jgi:hypothetical protein
MPVTYDILDECTKVRGEIGEIIASGYLKKLGFIVRKPRLIFNLLNRAGAPLGYEAKFLIRYQKTMDFFAVYPRDDPLVLEREAICEVFNSTGLNKYLVQSKSKGFVVEVKTGVNRCKSRPSRKQKRMFRLGRKLGFGVIIAHVTLKENYRVEIMLKNEEGEEWFANNSSC